MKLTRRTLTAAALALCAVPMTSVAAQTTDAAAGGVGTEFMVFEVETSEAAKEHFLRGLALHGDYLFAGFSPATIFCIDRHSGKLVDAYFHSDDARDCIHGLAVSD